MQGFIGISLYFDFKTPKKLNYLPSSDIKVLTALLEGLTKPLLYTGWCSSKEICKTRKRRPRTPSWKVAHARYACFGDLRTPPWGK